MEIGQDIVRLMEIMKDYSDNSLRKSQDIEIILELAAQSGDAESINLILLYSASLWNLYKTIQRQSQNNEILQRELSKSALELSNAVKQITQSFDDNYTISRFDQLYFGSEQGNIMNLIDLAHDFDIMKRIQTKAKFSKKNT